MTVNIKKALAWFENNKGKLTYSMTGSRNGSDGTADCSGSVVQALFEAGASKPAWLYNTDSIHPWLIQNGFQLIAENTDWDSEAGDIVIWGKQGESGGSAGHIMILKDGEPDPVEISCDFSTRGEKGTAVQEYKYNDYYNMNGAPYVYVYRLYVDDLTPSDKEDWVPQIGLYTTNIDCSLSFGDMTEEKTFPLKAGQSIKYDAYLLEQNGFVWIRQPRENSVAYLKTGETKDGKRVTLWGTFQ